MFGWTHNMLAGYLVLALVASAVHAGNDFQPVRRDHVNLKRMVKKRDFLPVIGAGQDPAENPPVTSTTVVLSVTTSGTTVPTVSSVIPSSIGTSGTPNIINSLVSDLVPSTTSASTSSISSSTLNSTSASTTSTTTSTSSTSTTEAPTTTPPPPPAAPISISSHPKITSTVVKTAEQEEATSVPAPTGAAATKSKALEVIIIIASSIGGIAILWTVFRKWKLGRSSKFNERLQPIDWEKPTSGNNNNEVMPGVRRAASNASSFHSASVHDHHHHGDAAVLQPIPEHDFTAGVAPVGGYADLARGPSPPMGQIHGGAALGRGYEYDNSVPLHHQAGGAYGAYDYPGAPRY